MLVGNYANTLLNTSFEFPAYIRHAYSKNLFENLDDEHVMLGVAVQDTSTWPSSGSFFSTEGDLLLLIASRSGIRPVPFRAPRNRT